MPSASRLNPAQPDRPYRILMVLDQRFPPDVRVENEAIALVKAGFEVVLLILAPDTRSSTEEYQGFTIMRRYVPKKFSSWMRGLAGTIPLLTWYIAWQIRKLRKKITFDAIHAHDLYMCGGALKAGRRAGVPVIADLHEVWIAALRQYAWSTQLPGKLFISIRMWKALEKRWINRAKNLIAITDEGRARYVSLGCSDEKVIVLPNTINIDAFDAYSVDETLIRTHKSEFTLVYTGGINLHRGLDFLLDTMPLLLEHCNARLVIVGDGSIRAELETQAKSLGIADHVIFEGWRPQAEIKSYILASDLCLVPMVKSEHTDTTLPHKLFHYMYLKRPVVVTNCIPMEKIVESANCGAVVPYGDHEAFASCLIELYKDPIRRKQMASNGHQAVLERYNWDHSVRSLIEMYRKLKEESEGQQ